jgi:hypothetical protein
MHEILLEVESKSIVPIIVDLDSFVEKMKRIGSLISYKYYYEEATDEDYRKKN